MPSLSPSGTCLRCACAALKAFDSSGSGKLNWVDFADAMDHFGFSHNAEELFRALDRKQRGYVLCNSLDKALPKYAWVLHARGLAPRIALFRTKIGLVAARRDTDM